MKGIVWVLSEAIDFGAALTGDNGKVLEFPEKDAAEAHLETLPRNELGNRTHFVSWRVKNE